MMMRAFALILCLLFSAAPARASSPVQEISGGRLTAWLIEDHTLPVMTVKLTFEDSGSAYDPKGKEGVAHFVSQMLDEGAGDMDSLAFHSALESNAIRFSTDANEDTFTVSVQSLSEYKGRAFELLDLALTKPRFDSEAVERVRADITSNLKEIEEDPAYIASLNWKRLAFGSHPYARPRRGTLSSLGAITPADLQQFAKTGLRAQAVKIAVVGDITPQEVKAWLAKLDKEFPRQDACAAPCGAKLEEALLPEGGVATVIPVPVPQTVVTASLPGVKRDDPRYYTLAVLNYALGGSTLTARLGKEIRDKRGLAYYAQSEVVTFDHAGYIAVQFATRNAQADEAVKVFLAELKKTSEQGISKEEFEGAKRYLTGSFPLQLDTEDALADYLLSMQHYHLGRDYLEKRNSLIEAVTLEQVNEAARTLLSHVPLIVMAGQPEEKR